MLFTFSINTVECIVHGEISFRSFVSLDYFTFVSYLIEPE